MFWRRGEERGGVSAVHAVFTPVGGAREEEEAHVTAVVAVVCSEPHYSTQVAVNNELIASRELVGAPSCHGYHFLWQGS